MDKYEFRVKFDPDRELFVLLARLSRFDKKVSEYFEGVNITFTEPYEFQVCIPLAEIPDQFNALGAKLPDGVKLIGIRFASPSVCFLFEFTESALIEATPHIYRHWIQSVAKAGYFSDLFLRF